MTNIRFSQSAIDSCKEALAHKVVLLCELEEIVTLMERDNLLKDFMKVKIKHAVANKDPLYKMVGNNSRI